MIEFRLKTVAEMDAAHAASPRARLRAITQPPPLRIQNTRAVLDLGNLVFFTFQGRAYGVPPLPYKDGQRLTALSLELQKYRGALTEETAPLYWTVVRQLPPLLWRLSRPVGRFRRALRRLGLHRNPFAKATEAELGELLAFFSGLRTKSSVQPLTALSDLAPWTC